uniref:Response regulatory domain-containing protein n=1 Tax=Ficus carica TaxID=3494 RepID=A0AA88EC69_FICCA|nr:hypothetical protein TIFTF001_052761 [Ficus carica]GMN72032.1 hypothetical protein TIFTF001_052763 [Ficus carica]
MIITDYSMPGMTGFDLLREIKKSKYHKDVPVIIMSSENVPSRINRCLEEGAEEFFLKPVQLSDVKKLKPHLLKYGAKTGTVYSVLLVGSKASTCSFWRPRSSRESEAGFWKGLSAIEMN